MFPLCVAMAAFSLPDLMPGLSRLHGRLGDAAKRSALGRVSIPEAVCEPVNSWYEFALHLRISPTVT